MKTTEEDIGKNGKADKYSRMEDKRQGRTGKTKRKERQVKENMGGREMEKRNP